MISKGGQFPCHGEHQAGFSPGANQADYPMPVQFQGFPEALNAMNDHFPRMYSPLIMQRASHNRDV